MKRPRDLLLDVLGRNESDETDDSSDDQRPCNETGHDWETQRVRYYSHGVDSFKIVKKTHSECSKCGRPNFEREKVGTVNVDKETEEITVDQ